jgi:hypothetical protein
MPFYTTLDSGQWMPRKTSFPTPDSHCRIHATAVNPSKLYQTGPQNIQTLRDRPAWLLLARLNAGGKVILRPSSSADLSLSSPHSPSFWRSRSPPRFPAALSLSEPTAMQSGLPGHESVAGSRAHGPRYCRGALIESRTGIYAFGAATQCVTSPENAPRLTSR